MSQSWENYYNQEENRAKSKAIMEGYCPVCELEETTLILLLDGTFQCTECGLIITEI
jgi:Ser/Thr protein kinase RdoA (MazF antagonist)